MKRLALPLAALALLAPAQASAQEEAQDQSQVPQQAHDQGQNQNQAQQQLQQAPADAKVRIALKNVNGSRVHVGSKILGVGYVRPFVPNQEVRVWVCEGQQRARSEAPDDQAGARQGPGPFQDPLQAPDRGWVLPGPRQEGGLAEPGGLLEAVEVGRHFLSGPRPGAAEQRRGPLQQAARRAGLLHLARFELRLRHRPGGPRLSQGERHVTQRPTRLRRSSGRSRTARVASS